MKKYELNTFPSNEQGLHYNIANCPCRPTVYIKNGEEGLMHKPMLDAIPWIAVEIFIGFRCAAHRLPVDQRDGMIHMHRLPAPPLYEYPHSMQ